MELSKREKTIKYIVYAAVIAVLALLQNVLASRFEIFGARCFIVVPTAIFLGIGEDEKTASLIGLFSGFALDIVSAHHMGFNCIYLMLICYVTAALAQFVFRSTFWFQYISASVGSLLYSLLYWALFIVPKGGDGRAEALMRFYLPSAVYTVVVAVAVCFAVLILKKKLNKEETIES